MDKQTKDIWEVIKQLRDPAWPPPQRGPVFWLHNLAGDNLPSIPFDPDTLSLQERVELLSDRVALVERGQSIEERYPGKEAAWYSNRLTQIAGLIVAIQRGWKPKGDRDARD